MPVLCPFKVVLVRVMVHEGEHAVCAGGVLRLLAAKPLVLASKKTKGALMTSDRVRLVAGPGPVLVRVMV